MRSVTALILAFHVALDHFRSATFRRLFLWTAAATGASVALLGIAQRVGLTRWMIDPGQRQNGQPFGPFNYHANAGSLLLLTLAAAVALAAAARVAGRPRPAAAASGLALLTAGGLLANTSRAAVVLMALLLAAVLVAAWRLHRHLLPTPTRRAWRALALAALLAAGLLAASAAAMPGKWRALAAQIDIDNPRLLLARINAPIAADAGLFGYGPNTFSLVFPISPHFIPKLYSRYILTFHTPGTQVRIWSNAHNDLLQAIIEWGWVGGAVWTALALSTLAVGVRELNNLACPFLTRILLLGPVAGLLAVTAHCLVDFPFQVLCIQFYATCFAAFIWAHQPVWQLRLPGRR
jgi:hypothetical protein